MKLFYIDINYDMIEILVNQVVYVVEVGWCIFYIVLNFLFFEKECVVLENFF